MSIKVIDARFSYIREFIIALVPEYLSAVDRLPAQASSFFVYHQIKKVRSIVVLPYFFNRLGSSSFHIRTLTPGIFGRVPLHIPEIFCDALHSSYDPCMPFPPRRLLLAQLLNFDSPLGPKATHIGPQFPLRFQPRSPSYRPGTLWRDLYPCQIIAQEGVGCTAEVITQGEGHTFPRVPDCHQQLQLLQECTRHTDPQGCPLPLPARACEALLCKTEAPCSLAGWEPNGYQWHRLGGSLIYWFPQ